MFKKILSFALVLALILSVAVFAVSAAETDAAEVASPEVDLVETAAGNTIYFDTKSSGWNFDQIGFHIWSDDDTSFEGYDWPSKSELGEDEGDGIWSYCFDDHDDQVIKSGCQYCVIFYAKKDGNVVAQSYDLLFGIPCLGKTAALSGNSFENPEDSHKTAYEAVWSGVSASNYGPKLGITSIGTVVGTCCPASTTRYKIFVKFLTDKLFNARTYSGKADQQLIDDTANALGIGQDKIETAITEAGYKLGTDESDPMQIKWTKAESKASEKSDASVDEQGGGPGSATGQETTTIYIMLGVLVAAAGVVFFARKRVRA